MAHVFDEVKCPYCGNKAYFSIKDHGMLYYWCPDCKRGVAKSPRGRRGARIPTMRELAAQQASQ